MPAKHHLDEDQLSKQDPTERRRLQNRLSQRNHRRKIRDRIAKLQERVIASELRAAATLHGWHSTPCIPYEVKPSPSSASSSLSLSPGSASASSSPTELQRQPSFNLNLNVNQIPHLPVLSSTYEDAAPIGSLNTSGTSSPTELVSPDSVVGTGMMGHGTGAGAGAGAGAGQAFGLGLDTMQLCEQWGFQGSVYLATESSLPQILQTLGPSSNAIILVPTTGYPVNSSGSTMGYTHSHGLDLGGYVHGALAGPDSVLTLVQSGIVHSHSRGVAVECDVLHLSPSYGWKRESVPDWELLGARTMRTAASRKDSPTFTPPAQDENNNDNPTHVSGHHGQPSISVSSLPPKPKCPAAILHLAMVARGEIGYLVASLAESSGIFGQNPQDGGSSKTYLIAVCAISLCTLLGPICGGTLGRRVLALQAQRLRAENERDTGGSDPLRGWGI
ncbi:transcription factor xanC [Aspergillus mulundensis]|uniref:BZIP domain-containing protein n=1 Tax=Aspergillus mulundensis TaxID=1810919 RepID=A0A3D8T316_9EURO|nr:hypothetical protein DSM5745_00268 [Aspergillus mulundensis]RDW92946.1 hypothetical protein DSM5745_00268 [Aspergillus mulundensis]